MITEDDDIVWSAWVQSTLYERCSDARHGAGIYTKYTEQYVDGDKVSYIGLHSIETCEEVLSLIYKRSMYISSDGSILYSASNTVIDVVTKTLSW